MKALFASVAIVAVIGTAIALDCFTCNSFEDSACSDAFKKDSPALQGAFVTTCDTDKGTPFCRKSKYYIESVTNSTTVRIQRDCGYKRREGFDCYQKRAEDYIMDVCQCDDVDLCNGSPALTFSMAPVLALTMPFLARFL